MDYRTGKLYFPLPLKDSWLTPLSQKPDIITNLPNQIFTWHRNIQKWISKDIGETVYMFAYIWWRKGHSWLIAPNVMTDGSTLGWKRNFQSLFVQVLLSRWVFISFSVYRARPLSTWRSSEEKGNIIIFVSQKRKEVDNQKVIFFAHFKMLSFRISCPEPQFSKAHSLVILWRIKLHLPTFIWKIIKKFNSNIHIPE